MHTFCWLHKSGYESYIIKSAYGYFQFLLIYRKAKAGELAEESGLNQLAMLTEINVEEVGVGGAKNFFEAKVIADVDKLVKEHFGM